MRVNKNSLKPKVSKEEPKVRKPLPWNFWGITWSIVYILYLEWLLDFVTNSKRNLTLFWEINLVALTILFIPALILVWMLAADKRKLDMIVRKQANYDTTYGHNRRTYSE